MTMYFGRIEAGRLPGHQSTPELKFHPEWDADIFPWLMYWQLTAVRIYRH